MRMRACTLDRMDDERLSDLENLDAEAAEWLTEAGIDSPEALRGVGAIGAFMACAEHHEARADWDVLYRLEGAVRGVDWQDISQLDRDQMRADVQSALGLAEL